MAGIIGLIAFFIILGLSLLVTKIATVALVMTGLSEEAANFQARSAFTGTGFTTSEAEKVVNHPVRRKIIMILMVLRSAGLVTIIISLILSLGISDGGNAVMRVVWLGSGALVLWILAKSKLLNKYLRNLIKRILTRWTDLDARDYASILHLYDEYRVMEVGITEGDWLEGKDLSKCKLNDEGVTVLGIVREDGTYVGAPQANTEIYAGDTLILYGRSKPLQELDKRRSVGGEISHEKAVDDQRNYMEKQDRKESQRKHKSQSSDS